MAKPYPSTRVFKWATAPVEALVDPSASIEADGILTNQRWPAAWMNWILNSIGQWITYLSRLSLVELRTWIVARQDPGFVTPAFVAYAETGGVGGEPIHLAGGVDGADTFLFFSVGGEEWVRYELDGAGVFALVHAAYDPAGDVWCVVASNGNTYTSSPISTWTKNAAALGAGFDVQQVLWSPSLSLFVAVGDAEIKTSPDGITWTSRHTGGGPDNLKAIADSGALLAVGGDGGVMLTSPDGITWTDRSGFFGATEQASSMAYSDGVWYAAIARSGLSGTQVWSTTDPTGAAWSLAHSDSTVGNPTLQVREGVILYMVGGLLLGLPAGVGAALAVINASADKGATWETIPMLPMIIPRNGIVNAPQGLCAVGELYDMDATTLQGAMMYSARTGF